MITVFVSGAWDLFHVGHLRVIQEAARLGDFLVVGVATDEYLVTFKPKPIISFEQRCEIVRGLRGVDVVIPHRSASDAHDLYDVDVRVVGPDFGWHPGQREWFVKFAETVEVVTFPRTPNISTTIIKGRIRNE